MCTPPLVKYSSVKDYRKHYKRIYCKTPLVTFDNITVWFPKSLFNHAFSESSRRNKTKDCFSPDRSQRIDWIKLTLQHPDAELYCGWDKYKKRYDPTRRVSVVYGNYAVIIQLTKKHDGTLKGEFKTAYVADNSIEKIRNSPKWNISLIT
ncbi:hypothetical protein KAR91_36495 [Candidatus Pacearchaeota archaeon]|nr:hypothetical protein [Candidatus Pacearchaeota archaeon]